MEALEREMADDGDLDDGIGVHSPAATGSGDGQPVRLRRALGPISLTALGIGAIIGSGIFVMTGRAAAQDAGPAVIISFVIAGIGCTLAALCYAEFAAMAPVAGSAYTYAYATLGELLASIIGWDLILEYAMGCATVAASWAHYFDSLVATLFGWHVPLQLSSDPFSTPGAWFNLPAVVIMVIVTWILVIGIREGATTNAILVGVKLLVVLFVILVGWSYIDQANWTQISPAQRHIPENPTAKWGILGLIGLNDFLKPIDDHVRSSFAPYGLSGMMLGAAIVFFAYIGFDSISTHSEEAKRPQRDVPIGILTSLVLCTFLYIAVAVVITGMEPYYQIDVKAAIATAFQRRADQEQSLLLRAAAALIAIGALAGMTSVLLVTFLSQARIFLAMSRERLLPPVIFGRIHPVYRTPARATILTGIFVCAVAALTPIVKLEEMVNIGTLMAFVIVCAAVLIMRLQRPDVKRPFRCPLVYVVAPLGIVVNLGITLFLPWDTWLRLVVWLALGLVIYFFYSHQRSILGTADRALEGRRNYQKAMQELQAHYEKLDRECFKLAAKIEAQLKVQPSTPKQTGWLDRLLAWLWPEPEVSAEEKQKLETRRDGYRRLAGKYKQLALDVQEELHQYDAIPKQAYVLELRLD
jgi:APA family basic amino acid/polyamine antiporter